MYAVFVIAAILLSVAPAHAHTLFAAAVSAGSPSHLRATHGAPRVQQTGRTLQANPGPIPKSAARAGSRAPVPTARTAEPPSHPSTPGSFLGHPPNAP